MKKIVYLLQVWSINYRRAMERVWMSWWQCCHTLQDSSGSGAVWIVCKADRGSWWVQEMLFSVVLDKENKMALTNLHWKPLVLIWHSTPLPKTEIARAEQEDEDGLTLPFCFHQPGLADELLYPEAKHGLPYTCPSGSQQGVLGTSQHSLSCTFKCGPPLPGEF